MRTFDLAALSAPALVAAAACSDLSGLQGRLSSGAQILLPGNSTFNSTAARWSNLHPPTAKVIVVPAVEQDVVETILYANGVGLPFLATSGAHGSVTTLGALQNGIEIHLSQLSSIKIAADGQSVTAGGGVRSKNLTDALWEAGKQTVTGTCECVSYLGPALGGGHGWLQGRHGLVSDQILSLRVALANGSVVTASETENADLFWGLRGAGHNFGIVTSVTSRIYNLTAPNYALSTFFFSGDLVEKVYETANALWLPNGTSTQPADFNNWSYWFYDSSLDADKPVVVMYLIQEGASAVDSRWTAPFAALGPILTQNKTGTYRDLAAWTGIDLSSTPCQITGRANPRFPVYLQQYNTTAQRQVYELFRQATTNASTPFASSLFMFEGYAQAGVKAPGDAATAFPYRADNLLIAPLLSYTPDGTAALESRAHALGNQIRDALWAGRGDAAATQHTYVNYAYGDETPENWYGPDAARQAKLRALKKAFDPRSEFGFYAPIA